jgi:nicotinamidase-related amidase
MFKSRPVKSKSMTRPTLIIIDMQQAMHGTPTHSRNNRGAEAQIEMLLAAWRKSGSDVVHVRHISRSPHSPFRPGQSGCEFQPALMPQAAEHVLEKNTPDAFTHTGLERWLFARDIKTIAIVGVSTNNSVESTARTSGNLGFRTLVVSDATFAFEKADYSGVLRSAEEVHAMSLANLDGEYATVITANQLLNWP